jgi:hypothetical protein
MTTKGNVEGRVPPDADAGGNTGSRQRPIGAISSQHSPRRAVASPEGGHRRLRKGQHLRSSPAPGGPPDLGVLAREAVVGFLHDASVATAQREVTRSGGAVTDVAAATATPTGNTVTGNILTGHTVTGNAVTGNTVTGNTVTGNTVTGGAGQTTSHSVAESAAWRAAAVSVAALDRIEATAAKVEADIAAALQAHAELQAGAGTAAEAAVHAAQSAWVAAHLAVAADSRAKIALRRVEHYVTITVALLVIAIIVLGVTAVPVH